MVPLSVPPRTLDYRRAPSVPSVTAVSLFFFLGVPLKQVLTLRVAPMGLGLTASSRLVSRVISCLRLSFFSGPCLPSGICFCSKPWQFPLTSSATSKNYLPNIICPTK